MECLSRSPKKTLVAICGFAKLKDVRRLQHLNRFWAMDWPLTCAITGIVALTGAAAYGVVSMIENDAPPPRKVVKVADPTLTLKAALPLFVPQTEPHEEFPTTGAARVNLTDPPPRYEFDPPPPPADYRPAAAVPKVERAAIPKQAPAKTASLTPPAAAPSTPGGLQAALAAVQWRVVPTANASYFNLGGHIDKAGIVDNVATPHLRDAFKAHRNFSKLPPDLQTHILTQNISLPKIAPYRGLLGIDDKKIEEEQAVRFERVGGPRAAG